MCSVAYKDYSLGSTKQGQTSLDGSLSEFVNVFTDSSRPERQSRSARSRRIANVLLYPASGARSSLADYSTWTQRHHSPRGAAKRPIRTPETCEKAYSRSSYRSLAILAHTHHGGDGRPLAGRDRTGHLARIHELSRDRSAFRYIKRSRARLLFHPGPAAGIADAELSTRCSLQAR